MAVRLFLAVDLTAALTAAVDDWIRRLARRLGPRRAAELKLADADRLHLTLHFFGEVAEPDVDDLCAVLGVPFDSAAYDLELGAPGTFPSAGRPRVVWLGLDRGQDETIALQKAVATRLHAAPFMRSPDARPFHPHLTVARVRPGARPGLARDLSAALDAELPPGGACRVDRVTLYRSHLSPRGPSYEALMQVPLSDG
jgi:2'-5' RNA ligase